MIHRRPSLFILLPTLVAALALCSFIGSTSCSGRSEVKEGASDDVVARVNGVAITKGEFESGFAASGAKPTEAGSDPLSRLKVRLAFLDQLINNELLRQEAARLGIAVTPDQVDAALQAMAAQYPAGEFEAALQSRGVSEQDLKSALYDRLLSEAIVQQVISATIQIRPEEIAAFYRARPDQFERAESARVLQIVVATEPEANEILAQLDAGAAFEDMARAKSIAPEAGKGGDLGWVVRGQLPEQMDAAIWTLGVGERGGVVATGYGFHVFKVVEKRPAGLAPLAEVSDLIASQIREERVEEAWEKYMAALRSKAAITINESLLGEAPAGTGAEK